MLFVLNLFQTLMGRNGPRAPEDPSNKAARASKESMFSAARHIIWLAQSGSAARKAFTESVMCQTPSYIIGRAAPNSIKEPPGRFQEALRMAPKLVM